MHSRPTIFAILSLVFSALGQGLQASPYDDLVLADHPVAYLTLGSTVRTLWEPDRSGHGHSGYRVPRGGFPWTQLPNGDKASVLNGATQYLEIQDHPSLSVPATGVLTVEAWIRPDTLQFPHQEGSGYVYWSGKGQAGAHEYALRMYSLTNTESRPNRISAYAFNLAGGLGSGSYFQDAVSLGEWIHVAAVINTTNTSAAFPTGYVRLYKNGVLRDTTALSQFNVVPEGGSAPLRIGTRDLHSYFKGAIGKYAVYGYELTAGQIIGHVHAMGR